MVGQIYPTKLQLNKANTFDIEAPFGFELVLNADGAVSSSPSVYIYIAAYWFYELVFYSVSRT